jgi:hypothetical protein
VVFPWDWITPMHRKMVRARTWFLVAAIGLLIHTTARAGEETAAVHRASMIEASGCDDPIVPEDATGKFLVGLGARGNIARFRISGEGTMKNPYHLEIPLIAWFYIDIIYADEE